jgi:nucleoside-diphosphate-sugar epimerase
MSLKIGITGASGVLGSELKKRIKKNLSIFKGDITKKKDVYDWVKKHKFKSIFHFAAVVPIKEINKSLKKSFKVNSIGTKYLADAIIKFQSKKIWFFYSSTSHVYKLNYQSIKTKETDKCNPQSLYGSSKREAEKYIIKKFSKNNYQFLIGRILSFNNKNKKKTFFVPSLIKKLLKFKKNRINKIDNIDHYRDFLTTKDIINAILFLKTKKKTGIFNIGSGHKLHLVDIINHLNKFTKKNIKIAKNTKRTYLIANITKLKKSGWKQKYIFFSELTDIFKYKILNKNYN